MEAASKPFCVAAIRGEGTIPDHIRAAADGISEIEVHRFDESYLEFLDQQIALNARGDEWTDRLHRRRKNLSSYANHRLCRCRLKQHNSLFTFEIEMESMKVIHWEQYERE